LPTPPSSPRADAANLTSFIRSNGDGLLYPAVTYWDVYHRPDLVQKALRIPGE
jgi:hypothetical protein